MKNNRKKKNKVNRAIKIFSVIGIILWIMLYALNYYVIGDEVIDENGNVITASKKKVINALVCGTNQTLTDTILYIKYNVETGKISMMSIPRDTYVNNEYCIGHKINAIYRGKNAVELVNQVEEFIGEDIDYYLFFDSKMLIELVDAIGGVEVDVPMRMKYDDPTQNLHIDLKKGRQILNGAQAEQFVRFRKNNDGSGYAMGDLQRTKVQQEFIKEFAKQALTPKNLLKVNELIDIILKNTDTNVTAREALKYISDIPKIDLNGLYTCTAPNEPKYVNDISYVFIDTNGVKEEIKNNF